VETQFGEFGQGASLPSLTPSIEGLVPEQPTINTGTSQQNLLKAFMGVSR
jgi:hypothetical protein